MALPLFFTTTVTFALLPRVTLAGGVTETTCASFVTVGGVGVGVGVVLPPMFATLIRGSLVLSRSPDHAEVLPLEMRYERTCAGLAPGLTDL